MTGNEMVIRYSSRTGEVAVVGTRVELESLASLISAGNGEAICSPEIPTGPYDRRLGSVMVHTEPGRSVVLNVVNGETLLIGGDSAKLGVLAKNIQELTRFGKANEHLHVEYFPGHFYLGPESVPTVVAFE
jgi:hypothetical protein